MSEEEKNETKGQQSDAPTVEIANVPDIKAGHEREQRHPKIEVIEPDPEKPVEQQKVENGRPRACVRVE